MAEPVGSTVKTNRTRPFLTENLNSLSHVRVRSKGESHASAGHLHRSTSEKSLRTSAQSFVAHSHSERNHQGLANRLTCLESDDNAMHRPLAGMEPHHARSSWAASGCLTLIGAADDNYLAGQRAAARSSGGRQKACVLPGNRVSSVKTSPPLPREPFQNTLPPIPHPCVQTP